MIKGPRNSRVALLDGWKVGERQGFGCCGHHKGQQRFAASPRRFAAAHQHSVNWALPRGAHRRLEHRLRRQNKNF